MTEDEFIKKYREILCKAHLLDRENQDSGFIFGDEDWDYTYPDYGCDNDKYMVFQGERILPIKLISSIKYHCVSSNSEDDYDGSYLKFVLLEGKATLYIYFSGDTCFELSFENVTHRSYLCVDRQLEILLRAVTDSSDKDDFLICDDALLKYHGLKANVVVPAGIKTIFGNVFNGVQYTHGIVKEVVLAEETVNIEEDAFKNASKIERIDLKNVRYIGRGAFLGCSSLRAIILPASLEHIGDGAFYNSGIKDMKQIINRSGLELGDWLFKI